jgi:hypothetical protein
LTFNCHLTALSQTDAYLRRELLRRTKQHCFPVRLDYVKAFDIGARALARSTNI